MLKNESKAKAITYTLIIAVVMICLSVHTTAFLFRYFEPSEYSSVILVSMIVPTLIAPPAAYLCAFYSIRLIDTQRQLIEMAAVDPLTGLLNRRAFSERMEAELQRMQRTDGPGALLLIDVDHFRSVNNTFGHSAGDVALTGIAQALTNCFRKGLDSIGRWGGEEFIVLLAETDLDGAIVAGERLRTTVETMLTDYKGDAIILTVSIGAVALSPNDTIEDAVARADHCLYAAKRSGRNRLVAAKPTPAFITVA
ncbi:MAG: GGDEF domain-containing protein [Pseudomonadota bacterium]